MIGIINLNFVNTVGMLRNKLNCHSKAEISVVYLQCSKMLFYFSIFTPQLQGDQLNMAVCFWYFVKSDLSSEHVYSKVAYTGQVTFDKVPEKHGHV